MTAVLNLLWPGCDGGKGGRQVMLFRILLLISRKKKGGGGLNPPPQKGNSPTLMMLLGINLRSLPERESPLETRRGRKQATPRWNQKIASTSMEEGDVANRSPQSRAGGGGREKIA